MSESINASKEGVNCTCSNCYLDDEQLQDEREHDKRIGWPEELKLESSKEIPLLLTGYSRQSRDEITNALLTLAKHNIGVKDLVNGFAVGEEGHKEGFAVNAGYFKEEDYYDTRHRKNYNAMKLCRVGRNFADFEVPIHYTYTADFFTPLERNASQLEFKASRVREMRKVKASLLDHRVIRLFVSDDDIVPEYDYDGSTYFAKQLDNIEFFIFLRWLDDFEEKKKKKKKEQADEEGASGVEDDGRPITSKG